MNVTVSGLKSSGWLAVVTLVVSLGFLGEPAWGQNPGRRSSRSPIRGTRAEQQQRNAPKLPDKGVNEVLRSLTDEDPDISEQQVYYGFYKDMDGWLAKAGKAAKVTGPVDVGYVRDNANGWTMIHLAAADGNIAAVEFLLKHGASVDATTLKTGSTPLYLAMLLPNEVLEGKDGRRRNFCEEMVKALIAAGANIDKAGKVGTPLHAAAKRGHANIITLLVDAGANVDARDAAGNTALHVAGTFETRDALVRLGADVNARNAAGATPLHVAAGLLALNDVGLLLSNGADPNLRTPRGASPAVWAGMGGESDWEISRRYETVRRFTAAEVGDERTLTAKGEAALRDELLKRYEASGVKITYNTGPQQQCPDCGGTGRVVAESVTAGVGKSFEKVIGPNGSRLDQVPCRICQGSGRIQGGATADDKARAAKAEGWERDRRNRSGAAKGEVIQLLAAFGAVAQSPLEKAHGLAQIPAAPGELKDATIKQFKRDVAARPKSRPERSPGRAAGATHAAPSRASDKSMPRQLTPGAKAAMTSAEIKTFENEIAGLRAKLDAAALGSAERVKLATELMKLRSRGTSAGANPSAAQSDSVGSPP